ncbi:MAG: UPF0175 family protein [Thermoanaerobacteraceae bacterium]|nr:UPF0175 family protein [Thermoanaerobacteraceae bacterium]
METIKIESSISKDVLVAAGISEKSALDEIRRLLSLFLFKNKILSFGKACELSGLNKIEFLELIDKAKISLNYDIEDYEEDLITVRGIVK